MQHKKSRSLTNKLKELFFPSQSKEEVKINEAPWEEKEGVKWVYFKERSEDVPAESEEDLTPKNYAEYIIKKKEEPADNVSLPPSLPYSGQQSKEVTFSVSEFARDYGHRGYGNEGKKTKEFKTNVREKNLEEEKALKRYTSLIKEDPSNTEARKKLIKLY
ncbi:MAG: hypothetical protein ABRQ38_24170, partial [Candidatus Eremiobacterota bacterium]